MNVIKHIQMTVSEFAKRLAKSLTGRLYITLYNCKCNV